MRLYGLNFALFCALRESRGGGSLGMGVFCHCNLKYGFHFLLAVRMTQGYHPHLSTRPDYKRSGSPVNITNYVKTSAAQPNDVVIYWGHDILYPMGFCVCIDLVHGLSASELLQGLKSKGVRSPDVSRALVREKLMVDRDSEIAATSLRVSLLCPLGKMRMTHPCRSTSCTHLQCFDAGIYLQMNEKKARWVCPVCDKPAPLSDLVIDG